jgi:hypothetical protein
MYHVYVDDNPKRSVEEKLRGILALFQERYGRAAGIVLVHPEQVIVMPSVLVVSDGPAIVRKDQFWVALS